MKSMKTQLTVLIHKPEFLISFFVMLCVSLAVFCYNCITYFGSDLVDIPSAYSLCISSAYCFPFQSNLPFILIIIAIIPFADSFLSEKSENTHLLFITKRGYRSYYFSKLTAVMVSVMVVIFVPFLLNIVLTYLVFPKYGLCDVTNQMASESQFFGRFIDCLLFGKIFSISQYLYILLFLVILTAFLMFCAVIIFNLSFVYKRNRTVLILLPFVFYSCIEIIANQFQFFYTEKTPPAINLSAYIFAFDSQLGKSTAIFFVYFGLLLSVSLITGKIALRKLKAGI